MTGAAPIPPSVPDMRVLLEGARTLGGAHGAVLEICLLTLCLPFEAVAIDLERIDWRNGRVPVPLRKGGSRILPLPGPARQAVIRIAGESRATGQAVTAGRGRPLKHSDVRLDRLQDWLADEAPATIPIPPWNFHGIRMAGRNALIERGRTLDEANAVAGVVARSRRSETGQQHRHDALAAVGLEIWCEILLGGGGGRSARR